MMIEARKLAFQGDCVLTPVYSVDDDCQVTLEKLELLNVVLQLM